LQEAGSVILQTPPTQRAGPMHFGPFVSSHAAPSAAAARQVPLVGGVPVLQCPPFVQITKL
jgi:hypothetical protein